MSSRRGSHDGFTLIGMVCVMAIVALIAAVILPSIPHETSQPRLKAFAVEAASLLINDRTAAMRQRREIATQVDATTRLLRSGSSGQTISIADDVDFAAILPQRCNQRIARSTINFFASGMSCGGVIALTKRGSGFEVRVNWLTGGIEIVPRVAS